MTWPVAIAAAVVFVAFLSVTRVIRRFLFAFALAAGVLLVLHMRVDPVEGGAALAAMAAGLGVARPVRRILLGRFI